MYSISNGEFYGGVRLMIAGLEMGVDMYSYCLQEPMVHHVLHDKLF